ncbi:Uncharacterised protein [Mycobacteroides abscessus subsp. abscessus]|nr:Uncharacterised protein [Mycobacteroides abscessus subsp. abscessus]
MINFCKQPCECRFSCSGVARQDHMEAHFIFDLEAQLLSFLLVLQEFIEIIHPAFYFFHADHTIKAFKCTDFFCYFFFSLE